MWKWIFLKKYRGIFICVVDLKNWILVIWLKLVNNFLYLFFYGNFLLFECVFVVKIYFSMLYIWLWLFWVFFGIIVVSSLNVLVVRIFFWIILDMYVLIIWYVFLICLFFEVYDFCIMFCNRDGEMVYSFFVEIL